MQRVQKAIELAVKYHNGQYRKEHTDTGCKLPFVVHPIVVMYKVFEWGTVSPVILAAAALHDIIEDTTITESELFDSVGKEVFDIVKELTFNFNSQQNSHNSEQKAEYISTFIDKRFDTLVIKCADRWHNVHDFLRVD